VNVSTTIPTTVQIRPAHLIGLLVAAAALAAAMTWLLVAFAFDSGATGAQPSASRPGAVTTASVAPAAYPPNYRGMP
jgi:hypothetical protein